MMDKSYVTSMWEDSIANSVTGGAIAGLPPDEPPVYRKKKKKYDGRRKDVREFVNKLLKKRKQREDKRLSRMHCITRRRIKFFTRKWWKSN